MCVAIVSRSINEGVGATMESEAMDQEHLQTLLRDFKSGALSLEQATERLRQLPYENLGYAQVDHHRALRQGFPEVIFGQGKTMQAICRHSALLYLSWFQCF